MPASLPDGWEFTNDGVNVELSMSSGEREYSRTAVRASADGAENGEGGGSYTVPCAPDGSATDETLVALHELDPSVPLPEPPATRYVFSTESDGARSTAQVTARVPGVTRLEIARDMLNLIHELLSDPMAEIPPRPSSEMAAAAVAEPGEA